MTDDQKPRYATGGVIRHGEMGPLVDEGGCSYVIPNRCRHCILGTCVDPLHAQPAGIIRFHRQLTDDEFREFERRWRWSVKAQGTALRIINEDGGNGPWFGRRPPWWKRAYYRARRWQAAAVLPREDLILCLQVLGVICVWLSFVFLFASGFLMGW